MNFMNAHRFSNLVSLCRSSGNMVQFNEPRLILIKRTVHNNNEKNVSYVKRMKMLQNLREKSGINEESLKMGKCLVYHKGDPLLTDQFNISWINATDLNVDPKAFLENSILLGVSEDNQLQFSVQIAGGLLLS